MKKTGLNFICKNESHVINRMLESVCPITDLIVAVDTGSTDNTISLIRQYGNEKKIPTYVFERPFDNFSNSRNYALTKLKEVVNLLNWNSEETWGFWIDCDEIMEIKFFSKDILEKDIYYVTIYSENIFNSRQLFFNLSKQVYWVGPIHEYIKSKENNITEDVIKGIQIKYEKAGASWKLNLENKFLSYVAKLKEYVNDGHVEFRWLFYIGDSYNAAAMACRDKEKSRKYLILATKYYEEAASGKLDTRDEKYRVYERLAGNKIRLNCSWAEIHQTLLKTYTIDKRHAEPLSKIIEYYISTKQWSIAYVYSSFTFSNFHNNKPIDHDISEIIPCLYQWKIAFYHYIICIQLGKIKDGIQLYRELINLLKNHSDIFETQDRLLIRLHSPSIIVWRNKIKNLFNPFIRLLKLLLNKVRH